MVVYTTTLVEKSHLDLYREFRGKLCMFLQETLGGWSMMHAWIKDHQKFRIMMSTIGLYIVNHNTGAGMAGCQFCCLVSGAFEPSASLFLWHYS